MIYFSSSTGGFYNTDLFSYSLPVDVVRVSPETHAALMDSRAQGKTISADENGNPVAIDTSYVPSRPEACTPAQGLVALFALKNITEDNVLAAIAQIPDPVQQYTAKIGYQRATTWERNSPTMQAMAQLLQLSEQDLDALFAHAVTVQV